MLDIQWLEDHSPTDQFEKRLTPDSCESFKEAEICHHIVGLSKLGDIAWEYAKLDDIKITLTLAHLRIGYLVGNPEVGNSEYVGHQDCPPQPLCFFAQFIRYMGPG